MKKSAPPAAPESCGDRCALDATRCEHMALGSEHQRYTLGGDGCSRWTLAERCGAGSSCAEGGCVADLGEGADCAGDAARCGAGLLCATNEDLGGAPGRSCMRACDGGGCGAGERCVRGACAPTDLCDACDRQDARCVDARRPERCEAVADGCARWAAQADCQGTNTCAAGACVGTAVEGAPCSAASTCVAGLVCVGGTSTCMRPCTENAGCGPTGCRLTRGSGSDGVCLAGPGPTTEARCTVRFGHLEVAGDWDVGVSHTPPDPYLRMTSGTYDWTTAEVTDRASVDLGLTAPALDFRTLHGATVTVLDSDAPFSQPDEVARWRLVDHYAWDSATRAFDLTLAAPSATLAVTIECADP